jgi:hypothetical protein
MKKNLLLLSLSSLLFGQACKNNKSDTIIAQFTNGVYVINEGPYLNGNGSISYYDNGNKNVIKDVFYNFNKFYLGNVVQSMEVGSNQNHIVVNNSNNVSVVDANDFQYQYSITGLKLPRYFKKIDNQKAYITQWGDSTGAIKVFDFATKTITKTIWLAKGAENMTLLGNRMYVTCNGGLGQEDKLAVVDIDKDSLLALLPVGPNPNGIAVDASNYIWVLCSGQYDTSFTFLKKPGRLIRINTFTNAIDQTINFSSIYSQPSNMQINAAKNMLYFNYDGHVMAKSINDATIGTAIINRYFYGLGVDPKTNNIYGADAKDYSSNGQVIRYTPAGVAIDSFGVGVLPNGFVFVNP